MSRIYSNKVTLDKVGESVHLQGWVQKRRDLGGLIFIDLRDLKVLVQVVFNPDVSAEALKIADTVRSEYVVSVKGEVVKRDDKKVNKNIESDKIEIYAKDIEILSKEKTPPFQITEENINEDTRLKYPYIDLRRQQLQDILRPRYQINKA